MTATRVRLDAELVRRGLARSREQAGELVAAGRVTVAGLQAADLEDIEPYGEERLGQAGCFEKGQTLGDGQAMRPMHCGVLGIAAARQQRANLVAYCPTLGAFSQGGNGARGL